MNLPAWYYQHGGDVVGPLTPVQLKQAVTQGLINATTQVRKDNGPWHAASSINGLAQLLPPETAAASPSPLASDVQPSDALASGTSPDPSYSTKNDKTGDNYDVLDSATDGSMRVDVLGYSHLNGSRDPQTAASLFLARQAGLQLKQVRVVLNNGSVVTEAGALHYMRGAIATTSSVGGVSGLGKALFKNITTQESLFTPRYQGKGELYLEPSFGFYMIYQLRNEEIIADKGLFYCGSGSLEVGSVAQKNLSSALMGGEGFFQVSVRGSGLCVFAIPVPVQELKRVELNNDTLKVDGNFALMRTGKLNFTVEKSTKGLLGSFTSGEGLLQTFRGTGTVWLAPTQAIYSRISMGGLSSLAHAQQSTGTTT